MSSSGSPFSIFDYALFVSTFVISLLIGSYYGCVKKQKTNADMLVGGRTMAVIPIALSLMATRLSANLIVGFTSEMYYYGTLLLEMLFCVLLWVTVTGYWFLPVYFNLKLTSVYEYLELRFKSRVVRTLATATFSIQTVCYLGVVLFAPSVALQGVLHFPLWASVVCVGACATVYTSIGGLRAVVWTDAFQVMIYLGGLFAILIRGSINVGGLDQVFAIANERQRIQYLDFNTNIFIRHTSIAIFFGQGLTWMSYYGCNQTLVQRYCSMDSIKKARRALFINIFLVCLAMILAGLVGLVIFANYADCDPLSVGIINKKDQIATYFVSDHLADVPGLNGLFAACLYSGSLSTMSSGLNSLAAVTWEDMSQCERIKSLSESKKVLITKVLGVVFGIVAVIMAFLAQQFGSVVEASLTLTGSVTGPLLGVFILGLFIPFTNKKGAIVGIIIGEAIAMWLCAGTLTIDNKPPLLPLDNSGCEQYLSDRGFTNMPNITYVPLLSNSTKDMEWPQKAYTISYHYFPIIGCCTTIIIGCIISLFTESAKVGDELLSPLYITLRGWFSKSKSKPVPAFDDTKYSPVHCIKPENEKN